MIIVGYTGLATISISKGQYKNTYITYSNGINALTFIPLEQAAEDL